MDSAMQLAVVSDAEVLRQIQEGLHEIVLVRANEHARISYIWAFEAYYFIYGVSSGDNTFVIKAMCELSEANIPTCNYSKNARTFSYMPMNYTLRMRNTRFRFTKDSITGQYIHYVFRPNGWKHSLIEEYLQNPFK